MRIDLCVGCAWLVALALSACGSDRSAAGAGGAGGNAGESNGGGSETSDIAEWPMPNSPSLALPNPADYDASTTPGVVHDRVTGLDWLQAPGDEFDAAAGAGGASASPLLTRAEALEHCSALSFAGFDDWRVPAFIELVSLFDAVPHAADPLAPVYLAPIFRAQGRFWSTSPVNASGLGRLLDFNADGCGASDVCSIGVSANAADAIGGAFCVRSGVPPVTTTRYELSGGQIRDLRTGLIWLGVPGNAQTSDLAAAASTCAAAADGARLPSINELLSILLPILDKRAFPDWPADAFAWSSSAIPAKTDAFWTAAIGGATKAALSTDHHRVQCVR